MRLIDADMLLNSFKGAKKLGVDAIKYYVDNTPTIDIVRCGECIYRHEHEWYNTCDKHIGHGFPSDYFCGDGERRSDETTVGVLADRCGNHDYDCLHHRP